MKCRVIYNPDGVSVIYPASKSKREDETEEQWLARVFAKATPEGAEYDDIDESELPQDREDRNAWKGSKGKGVSIDLVKAAKNKADKEAKEKIQNKIRDLAIEDLKKDGELPPDYEDIKEK